VEEYGLFDEIIDLVMVNIRTYEIFSEDNKYDILDLYKYINNINPRILKETPDAIMNIYFKMDLNLMKWFHSHVVFLMSRTIMYGIFIEYCEYGQMDLILELLKMYPFLRRSKNGFNMAASAYNINVMILFKILRPNSFKINYNIINGSVDSYCTVNILPNIFDKSVSQIEDTPCTICVCENNNCILQCGHQFCYTCLSNVFNVNKQCPLCRYKFHNCFMK
jgi:hypothetical protein